MQEEDFLGKVAIATTTMYDPDSEVGRLRMGLVERTVKEATKRRYDIIVVDGGSSDEFLKSLESNGAIIHSEKGETMGVGRRQAIEEASKLKDLVVWTEPEKHPYIGEIWKTVVPLVGEQADLVVPARISLSSYPLSQQYSEAYGNRVWHEVTGHELDMFIGPRTWRADQSHYFLSYNGEYGDLWDSIFIPIMNMIRDGRRVLSVDVNYVHPQEQTRLEEGNSEFSMKRLNQLNNLVPAFVQHWKAINPQSD